jgi:hypothetical protein
LASIRKSSDSHAQITRTPKHPHRRFAATPHPPRTVLPFEGKTYSESQPKLVAWAEENLPEGFVVFAFPEAHRKRLRTSNACDNVNGQIKKRTRQSA